MSWLKSTMFHSLGYLILKFYFLCYLMMLHLYIITIHCTRKDRTCCIICTVHFKSMYSSFLLILELKSINLAYCAIMQTSMIYLDLIHVIKISLKKSSLQERDDCIFFRRNFTVIRTTFCYIQWYNVFTYGALLIIRLLHFSQINHFVNLFYLPQQLVMHVLLYLVID